MTARILVIGDPHIRIEEEIAIQHYIQSIDKLIKTTSPNIIVILGDILHNHEKIHSSSMNLAYSFFNVCRKNAKTFCLVGNHDAINNQIFLTDQHWMNGCKEWDNLTIVDKGTIFEYEGIQLCLIPYVPDGRFKEALSLTEGWEDSQFLFSHQLFNGCQMGPIIASNVEEYEDDYPLCFNGHIHTYQKIKPNLYCIGSSRPIGYADTQTKKCMFITATLNEDGSCKCKLKEYQVDNIVKQTYIHTVNELDKVVLIKDCKYVIKGTQEELKCFKKSKVYEEIIKQRISYQLRVDKVIKEEDVRIEESCKFFDRLYKHIENDMDLIPIYTGLHTSIGTS